MNFLFVCYSTVTSAHLGCGLFCINTSNSQLSLSPSIYPAQTMANSKLEPNLIVGAMVVTGFVASKLPSELTLGRLVLWLSVLFLVHTLVRDLYLYIRLKNQSQPADRRYAQCFCVESGVGILVLILGLALLTANVGGSVTMTPVSWFFVITICLWLNFWMKDFVFSWNPWRVYRDPDHLNIVPRFRVK